MMLRSVSQGKLTLLNLFSTLRDHSAFHVRSSANSLIFSLLVNSLSLH